MAQMNLPIKQEQTRRYREQTSGYQKRDEWGGGKIDEGD